jgi:ADP-heptose:LPS heptosyltransferase
VLDAQGVPRRFVAMHPGSGGRRKCWPAERFAAVAERLKLPVVWLLGPAERKRPELREAGGKAAAVIETPDLTALAGILAACEAYVGNDSGVTHLAAALRTATVAVFGATDPVIWAPRGPNVTVLGSPKTGGLNAVAVSDVKQAIKRLLAEPKSTRRNNC